MLLSLHNMRRGDAALQELGVKRKGDSQRRQTSNCPPCHFDRISTATDRHLFECNAISTRSNARYLIALLARLDFVAVGKVYVCTGGLHHRLRIASLAADNVRMLGEWHIDLQVDSSLLKYPFERTKTTTRYPQMKSGRYL